MATAKDILNAIKALRFKRSAPRAKPLSLHDELYIDLGDLNFEQPDITAENEKFPISVFLYDKAGTPGYHCDGQLRLIQFLNQSKAELHKDFVVRHHHSEKRGWGREYRFSDANIAMLFKLTFGL